MIECVVRCSVCDHEVPDAGDLVCVDCYDTSRRPITNPQTITLSRDDCHLVLGFLAAEGNKRGKAWVQALQVRFLEALEAATAVVAVDPHVTK